MISIIDLVEHLSYIIFAFGTGFRNVIYLRTSLIIVSVLQIIYTFYSVTNAFSSPIEWSVIAIGINLFQIAYILYNKKFMNLTHDERAVYDMMGRSMNIINFRKFMKAGSWVTYPQNQRLISENESLETLFYLVDGEVEVKIKDNPITKIKKGNFLGEMSFLSGELPSACVTTITDTKILSWDKGKLRMMMEKNDDFRHEIYSIFSNDLILKILNLNKQSILTSIIN